MKGRADPTEAILIEPHRVTTVAVDNTCSSCDYSWKLFDLHGYDLTKNALNSDMDDRKKSTVTITINATGEHTLIVKEMKPENGVMDLMRHRNFTTYVKYVRREVRQLTLQEISDMIISGEIPRGAHAWKEGMAGAVQVASIPEFAALLPLSSPPV